MRTVLLLILSVILTGNLRANEPPRRVSGSVTDEKGEILPYANILLKGTTYGTASDLNGNFTLQIPSSGKYSILVKYAGFATFEQTFLLNRDTTVRICLKEDALNLNEVTITATRTPKLLKDAPVITRVITTEDIQRINAVTVQDLLQVELPGLEFTREMDGQTAIHMQGMSGKYVLFLIDGERIAGETLNNIDDNRLNTAEIERIEILKGSASALYGSSAIGGVVNIITKESTKPWSLNVNGNYGSLNEQRYGLTFGKKVGNISSLTSATYKRRDTYLLTDTAGETTNINGSWDFGVNEKLIWRPNERLSFTAKGGYYTRKVDNYQENINDRYRNFNGSLRLNYLLADNQTLEVSYLLDRYNKYDYYIRKDIDSLNYRNTQHTARIQYNNTFREGNTLTAGAEFFRDELRSFQFDGTKHATNDYILYAQHDLNVTKAFNLVYGLRMDAYSAFGMHVSPNLSLMYKLKPVTFRGSYSRGFRVPSLKEMYTDWDMGSLGWLRVMGNPDLKSETSDNISLSAEYTRNRINFSLVGYHNRINNKIASVYNATRDTSYYTNIDHSSLTGLDANLAIKCPYGFTVKAAYSYVYERMKQDEVSVSTTRPHSATLGVNYEWSRKDYHLNVAVNGRYLGKLDTNEADMFGKYFFVHYPGYQTWRVVLTQTLKRAYTLQLSVDNLFNYKPKFYSANSPISPGVTYMVGLSLNIDELF